MSTNLLILTQEDYNMILMAMQARKLSTPSYEEVSTQEFGNVLKFKIIGWDPSRTKPIGVQGVETGLKTWISINLAADWFENYQLNRII